MFQKFARSRSGNFAILSGLAIVPLCLAAGLAIDYSRHLSAQRHLQEMVDATSLSLASSRERDQSKLENLATDFLAGNQNTNRVQNVRISQLKTTDDDVDIEASGSIPTTFMALAGYDRLDVRASALAERAVNGQVEVALILDNTYSMSREAGGGTTRIAALKTAANKLVDELLRENDGAAQIGIVPYAEYVNVGMANRSAPWIDVPADRSEWVVTQKAEPAYTRTVTPTRWERTGWVPDRACSRMNDGVREDYTCPGYWEGRHVPTGAPPYEEIVPAKEEKRELRHFKWWGCVASRTQSDNWLHDRNSERYKGFVQRTQICPTPIVELTSDKARLKSAIQSMTTDIDGYKSQTYIPAGMVWGLNILSPEAPFSQGAPYDPANARPRKVAVLMTDGANTMLRRNNGMHQRIEHNNEPAYETDTNIDKTNADTRSICTNMKRQGIEIFTVAFMVTSAKGKALMEACASDPSTHYFDASSSEDLLAAFEGIGNSLRVVRLAR